MISSNFAIAPEYPPVERKVPLELVRCDPARSEGACGVAQLKHSVPPALMYSSYGYRSGVNDTMRVHLSELVRSVLEYVSLEPGDVVLDIGANDGTLLRAYPNELDLRRVAFEPSSVVPEGEGIEVIREFFKAGAFQASGAQRAKVVTSIAMFYDLDDPLSFARDVREVLAEEGVWVIELAYLPTILERTLFDTICHEHLVYYSLEALEVVMRGSGFRVLDARLNEINGGSIRLYVTPQESHLVPSGAARIRLYDLRKREFEQLLDTDQPFVRFRQQVEAIRRDLSDLLVRLRTQGKRVMGYGASTKGNVILQYCEITRDLIECIADRNPAKWGSNTIGTGIPIVSEEEVRDKQPDYLLVLPWHFLDEFVVRESEFLGRGGRFITPLPQVSVVGPEALATLES